MPGLSTPEDQSGDVVGLICAMGGGGRGGLIHYPDGVPPNHGPRDFRGHTPQGIDTSRRSFVTSSVRSRQWQGQEACFLYCCCIEHEHYADCLVLLQGAGVWTVASHGQRRTSWGCPCLRRSRWVDHTTNTAVASPSGWHGVDANVHRVDLRSHSSGRITWCRCGRLA